MSKRLVVFGTSPLAIILFATAWHFYPQLLQAVASDTSLVFVSPKESLAHRALTALPFALLGVSIGMGTILSGLSRARPRHGINLLMLLFVGLAAAAGWTLLLANRIAAIGEHLGQGLPPGIPVSLSASAIPLHEIGLVASGSVLPVAVMLMLAQAQP